MIKWLTSHFFLGFLMLAALLVLHRTNMDWIESLRHHTFDFYQQTQPRIPTPDKQAAPVHIIDIDEKALREVGQWPWPRTKLAELVEKLTAYGVAVTGFDIVFAEEDRASAHQILKQRDDIPQVVVTALEALPNNEKVFAEAIKKARVVAGQVGVFEEIQDHELPRKVGFGILSPDGDRLVKPMLNRYAGVVENLEIIEDAATGIGLFSTRSGYGGAIRKVALVEKINDTLYPSLSLEMLRVALGGKDDYLIKGLKDGTPGIQSILVKGATPQMKFEIPTDIHGRVYVHFAKYSTAKEPLYISAADVLNPKNEATHKRMANLLAGSLVVIGTSAVGLKDIRKTPINPVLPGVEVHAQLLETILSDAHLTRPFEVVMIEWAIIFIGGMMMILFIPLLNSLWTFMLTSTIISAAVAVAWYYYTQHNQLLDASYPIVSLFSLFLVLGYLNYAREEKERKQVKEAFSHYVSPDLLDQLADNPEQLVLGGETRNITVLFSDIRGFTTISERFNAQELTRFINSFLTPMTNVILDRKGTIDKYMGDAIMAFWNAPLEVKNHAHHACHAALEMQAAVKALNAKLKAEADAVDLPEGYSRRRYAPIAIGVGVNTDDCCVGNMGSDQRFDYSALGDGVNLGARLEGQSKIYGVDTILGYNTAKQVIDDFAVIELDLLQVKGKTEPVRIFALLGDAEIKVSESFKKTENLVNDLQNSYRAQKWGDAKAFAEELSKHNKDLQKFSELLISRIVAFEQQPPGADWDGVAIALSK
ncbi:MAG: CHASE2 domain-containing protein [Rickettsiales bacterium]|nr:CHASE2 domain-containing protein [Rickettsiales bacterium]